MTPRGLPYALSQPILRVCPSFSGLAFSEEDFRKAMNVFGDGIAAKPETGRARDELQKLDAIQGTAHPPKRKCQEVWNIIRGGEGARA